MYDRSVRPKLKSSKERDPLNAANELKEPISRRSCFKPFDAAIVFGRNPVHVF